MKRLGVQPLISEDERKVFLCPLETDARMCRLPRFALGTVQPDADRHVMTWALLTALERSGHRVQSFLSQSLLLPHAGAVSSTGQRQRHLDSWLMSKGVCRELFEHGGQASDLAVVEGAYDIAKRDRPTLGGSLDTLCNWLVLPRLIILDAARLDPCGLRGLDGADGVLLDRVRGVRHAYRLKTDLESIWNIPVVGYLPELASLRTGSDSFHRRRTPTRRLCAELGECLRRQLSVDELLRTAERYEFPRVTQRLFRRTPRRVRPTIAVALDEAFSCFFPDTLDLLESRGARIRDFSPLRGERLPPDADLVYFGCGQVAAYARALARNHCMKQSLRSYAAAGGRIYAEGGGLAYLCRHLDMPRGGRHAMAGVLPAAARFVSDAGPIHPAALTLRPTCRLSRVKPELRGYLNRRWAIEPLGEMTSLAADERHRHDVVCRGRVLGSRLYLNLAAQPRLLEAFLNDSLWEETPISLS